MANEKKISPEMLEKCKEAVLAAKSAEEILAFAKQNNIEMSAEEAAEVFASYHKSGELSDDELGNVAGGGCDDGYYCEKCGHKMNVYTYWPIGKVACPVCAPEMCKHYEELYSM